MTKSTVLDWSTTANSNTTVDAVSIAENCAAANINNGMRSMMAAMVGFATAVATSGTNTYTATLAPVPDGYVSGGLYVINFASASTSTTPTLNLNSLGAKTIVQKDGSTALVSGDLNGIHWLEYDGTNFRLLNPVKYVGGTLAVGQGGTGITSGTSGGVLAFTASGTIASSAALTANVPVVGGGAGAAPTVGLTTFTNSLSGDVSLNNVSNYFDGPSVAQGTTGTFLVFGTVTVQDTAGIASISAKLWDGTNAAIDSGSVSISSAGFAATMTLVGIVTNPTGNMRISCNDASSTSGKILFNRTGNSKDSTLVAIRIG